MTNLDSILQSRDITLPTKVRLVKAMVFPIVMYGCESWTMKRAESQIIDAFELLLESSPTPQFKSINSSVLRFPYSPTQSHPYMTIGKTIALTRRTFVGKVMSLLLNMLSRLVITFLPRSNRLLISWLQSPPAVILEPPKIKSVSVSSFPIYFP